MKITTERHTTSLKMTVKTSKVVQVSNIAPQVTKDQMHVLFSFLGKIEDIRLYPTMRDASFPIHSRICYIKFAEASTVPVAQHMTNAVFIDRALIVIPMSNDEIPDECYVLEMTQHGAIVPGLRIKDPKLPPHVVNCVCDSREGRVILTTDSNLDSNGLPPYPPLPVSFDPAKVEESRRTVLMLNYDPAVATEEVIDFLTPAGEVKYMRTCKRDSDQGTSMLVEFTDQPSVVNALKMNGMEFKGRAVEIQHATQPIVKSQVDSNEAAQQEIEEAAAKFEEEQYLVDATEKPAASAPAKNERRSGSRSSGRRKRSRSRRRSRSRGRRSSSRDKDKSSRGSRSGDRNRRSTSTSKNGSRSRYRRSSSRSSNRRKSKERSSRIKSRDRDHDRSRDRNGSGDKGGKSRRQEASKDKKREKDQYSSSKGNRKERTTDNKSSEEVTSEKTTSRSRSRSSSRDRKKRDRQRSRSRGSRRRSPSPRISRKRKNRSRSRKRGKNSNRRD